MEKCCFVLIQSDLFSSFFFLNFGLATEQENQLIAGLWCVLGIAQGQLPGDTHANLAAGGTWVPGQWKLRCSL